MKQLISSLPSVFIKQGECHFSFRPELIITILGSCVAVIMYDVEKGACAISHCVLPSYHQYEKGESNGEENYYKYVDSAITYMLKVFHQKKILKHNINVKLFGGAEQLIERRKSVHSIGKQNIDKALEMCEKKGLNIVSMDVGGTEGRKIYLTSHTGEVLLSRLNGIKIIGLEKLK